MGAAGYASLPYPCRAWSNSQKIFSISPAPTTC